MCSLRNERNTRRKSNIATSILTLTIHHSKLAPIFSPEIPLFIHHLMLNKIKINQCCLSYPFQLPAIRIRYDTNNPERNFSTHTLNRARKITILLMILLILLIFSFIWVDCFKECFRWLVDVEISNERLTTNVKARLSSQSEALCRSSQIYSHLSCQFLFHKFLSRFSPSFLIVSSTLMFISWSQLLLRRLFWAVCLSCSEQFVRSSFLSLLL